MDQTELLPIGSEVFYRLLPAGEEDGIEGDGFIIDECPCFPFSSFANIGIELADQPAYKVASYIDKRERWLPKSGHWVVRKREPEELIK